MSVLVVLPPVGHLLAARAGTAAGDVVFMQTDAQGYTHIVSRKSAGTETTLTSFYRDQAEYPDVSSAGSKIAFDDLLYTYDSKGDVNGGGRGIWAMNSDGSEQTQLTFPNDSTADTSPLNFSDTQPRWSPNGTKIAFQREVYDSASHSWAYRIFVMNADGTVIKDVTPKATCASTPAWSPDGTKIAYIDCGALRVINADGTGAHLAYRGSVDSLDWSANGRMSVWNNAGASDLTLAYLTSTDGFASAANTTETGIYHVGPAPVGDLRASSDGNTVYYAENGALYKEAYTRGTWVNTQLSSGEQNNDPTLVDATWPNARTKTIVGLGDSVAAGEGINYGFTWTGGKWKRTGPGNPTWMTTAPALGANYQQCHQSGHGYPNLIALNGGNYKVYNMACTGASALQNTESAGSPLEDGGVLDPELFDSKAQPYPEYGTASDPSKTVPQQLGGTCIPGCAGPSAVFNNHKPNVVLLTLGANDVLFPYWITQCYDPRAGPCNTSANSQTLASLLTLEKNDLATTLNTLDDWAAGKSVNLRVLVTNYYDPFDSAKTNCIDYNVPIGGIGIDGSELAFLENGLTNLNSNIAADVKDAQNSDANLTISLVDLSSLFQKGTKASPGSHAWCTTHPWAYGPSIDFPIYNGTIHTTDNPAPFHPTPEGQDAIYQAVKTTLNSPA